MKSKILIMILFFIASFTACTSTQDTQRSSANSNDKKSKVFIFDPSTTSWAAYQNGHKINGGRASGGKDYCQDIKRPCRTVTGTYRIYAKRGADCVSSKYPVDKPGAKTPYCMFFYKGYAIHGSNNVPDHNASHGCIRVSESDAKWLTDNFLSIGTKVVVKPY